MYVLKDWIQYEEVSSEDALPGDGFEDDGFNSSLYATQSSLPEYLATIPNLIICPQASGDENEDVSSHKWCLNNLICPLSIQLSVCCSLH